MQFIGIGSIVLIVLFLMGKNHRVHKVYYRIKHQKVKQAFRIIHVSDLHATIYGDKQKTLLSMIKSEHPDLILMSGDMFDERRSITPTMDFMKQAALVCPCFYVSGNHEFKADINHMKALVMQSGVHVLEDSHVYVYAHDVNICGVDDPYLNLKPYKDSLKDAFEGVDTSRFTILLAHRPELIHTHLSYPCDLILSGHAHGGQWRIPYVLNGVFAPQQGIFPKYAGGMYTHQDKIHIVNRGLALITKVPRIYNRPEVVVIDVEAAS